jgi:hypothetical protein
VGEAGQDRERGVAVEAVGRIDVGHTVGRLGEALDGHVGVDAEEIAHAQIDRRFCHLDAAVCHLRPPGTPVLLLGYVSQLPLRCKAQGLGGWFRS